jgi:hypothetical protein
VAAPAPDCLLATTTISPEVQAPVSDFTSISMAPQCTADLDPPPSSPVATGDVQASADLSAEDSPTLR